jgi:hypothetical protein
LPSGLGGASLKRSPVFTQYARLIRPAVTVT